MTFDLTGIIVAVIGGVFSIAALVVGAWISSRMKDAQSAAVLGAAVKNALGAMQQAAAGVITAQHPTITIPPMPGASPQLAVGVQYVLDHAGEEAARFGVTPGAIADKINAQVGLANIASNIATAAAVGPTVAPLASVVAKAPLSQGFQKPASSM